SMLINWLSEDEMLLDIPPKPSDDTSPVNLTASQRRFVVLVNWLGVSLAVLLAGTTVWWRRR
ncbi:MAG: GldG family protein, partial [Armatimonadota bacterium]